MWAKVGLSLAILSGSYFSPIDTSGTISASAAEGSLSEHGTRQLQYQASAEPIVVPAAPAFVPSIDKLSPIYPSQFPVKVSMPVAIQAGSFFYTRYFPIIETVTVDKWVGTEPDIIRGVQKVPVALQSSYVRGEIPIAETVSLDKWRVSVPDRYIERGRVLAAIQAGSSFGDSAPAVEIPRLERWHPIYPDYINVGRHQIAAIQVGSVFWFPEDPNPASLNQFRGSYQDAIDKIIRLGVVQQQGGILQTVPPIEVISLDKWQPNYPDTVLRKPRWILTEVTAPLIEIIPIVTVDMTSDYYPDRVNRVPRLIAAIEAGHYTSGVERSTMPAASFSVYVWKRIA